MKGRESIMIWVPPEFKRAVQNVANRQGRLLTAVTRDALFGDPDLLDEYLAIVPPEQVQAPAPAMHARRAEKKAIAAKVGGDPDAGICGECGTKMIKVDDTTLGKTVFTRWFCGCGFKHLQRTPVG